ncbi:hypothetical protein [Pseudolysinimonas sp.]
MSTVWRVFDECVRAVASGLPTPKTTDDKEFHFQRWVADRIALAGHGDIDTGRNRYPDFPIPGTTEAYEVKGITVGSREKDFDSNSALPSGSHDGRDVFYVFGRYESVGPKTVVRDLVIAHGSLLNAGGGFDAKNTSMRVVGSFGDVLLRDRKMYVAYTPYSLLTNVYDACTLVLPTGWPGRPDDVHAVGAFSRTEHANILVGYEADLRENTLEGKFEPNPQAGRVHGYEAWALSPRELEVGLA